jgi:UDP:flavonoid glycosyltransferase YjiC (YdhE family)
VSDRQPQKTFLLVTLGTAGDIKPFLALAAAIRDLGHRPVLLLNPSVRDQADRHQLISRPVGRPMDADELIGQCPQYVSLHGAKLVFRDIFLALSDIYRQRTLTLIEEESPAAVVCHAGAFGSVWAADQAGVPRAAVHLSPTSLLSPEDQRRLRPWPARAITSLILKTGKRWARKQLRNYCQNLHLGSPREALDHLFRGGDLLLGLWSPRFRPKADDDPDSLRVCGFPRPLETRACPEPVDDFLRDGPPPVVFSLGTSAVHVAGDFYLHAAEACRMLGVRGLVLRGPCRTPQLPGVVMSARWAPHDYLLARAAGIVHHGGIGCTGQQLRAGLPGLTIPFGHDQFDNGAWLRRLGVSRSIWHRRATARRLARSLRTVLSDPVRRRADDLGRAVRKEPDGAATAARILCGTF